MILWNDAALAALASGDNIVAAAVYIATAPEPFAVWGGYGDIEIAGVVYTGIGDRGLAQIANNALGAAAQPSVLSLSGVDAKVLELLDDASLRQTPVVITMLVFNGTGSTLLDAQVDQRGSVDKLHYETTPGGEATIQVLVEGSVRGLGRSGARTRSDADQRSISPDDAGMSAVSYAGQKQLYWGGKPPLTVAAAVTPQQLHDALITALRS